MQFRHQMHENVGDGHSYPERDEGAVVGNQQSRRVQSTTHQKRHSKEQGSGTRSDNFVQFQGHHQTILLRMPTNRASP